MRYGSLVLLLTLVGAVNGQQPSDPMSRTFLQRVDEYVGLHRRLEGPLAAEVITHDPEVLFDSRRALAAALRTARSDARHGAIFTPAVAQYFRILVADAVREGGIENLRAILYDEETVYVPAVVNADYPAGRPVATMPPCLLAALPPLPPELRYGFVGRDLILWDVHAGLIVDFVPRAVPETT